MNLLATARELAAIAQTGSHFTQGKYDTRSDTSRSGKSPPTSWRLVGIRI
jgi:hypothetical protein